jgi:hypothetical protein
MDCGDVSPLLKRRHVGALQIEIAFALMNIYFSPMKKTRRLLFPSAALFDFLTATGSYV